MNRELLRVELRSGVALVSVEGDLTEERVDAIVNAANSRLMHGGGVAGAIVRKGGQEIQQESLRAAPVPTGSAAVTGAGKLPCRFVIHAVGPVWMGGGSDEEKLLASAVHSALRHAAGKECRTVSLPSVSAGIFGMPGPLVARILVATVRAFVEATPDSPLKEIRFCNVPGKMVELIGKELSSLQQAGH